MEYTIAKDDSTLTSNEHIKQILHPNDGLDNVDTKHSVEELTNNYNNIEDAYEDAERKPTTDKLSVDQNSIEKVIDSDHNFHTKDNAVNHKSLAKEINHHPTENVAKVSPIEYDRAYLNEVDVNLNKKHGHFRNNYVNYDNGYRNVVNNPGVQIYPISFTKNNLNEKYISSSTEEFRNKDAIKSKWDYTDITTIYLAGFDDQIFKLMYDIQKYGAGTELLVYFYIYSNNKYCSIGYFYTNRNVLRHCIANYSHYFCLDNNSGTSCLESLGIFEPNEISNIPMDPQINSQKIVKYSLMNKTGTAQTIEGNSEPISNDFYKLDTTTNGSKEYYPVKQSSDAYEFILPREDDMSSKDIYINLLKTENPKTDKNLVLENDNLNIKHDNVVNLSEAGRSDTKTNRQETHYFSETPSDLNNDTSIKTPDELYNSEDISDITSNNVSTVYEAASQGISHVQNVIEFLPSSNLSDKKDPEMLVQPSSYKGQEYNKLISNTNMLVTEENIFNNPQNNNVSSPGQNSIDTQNSTLNDTDFLLYNNSIVKFNTVAPGIENTNNFIYTSNVPEHILEKLNVINDTADSRFPKDENIILTGIPINRAKEFTTSNENLNILNNGITTDIVPNTVKEITNQGYEMHKEQNNISRSSKVDSPLLEDNNIIVTVNVEPHIDNSDDSTKFTSVKATHVQKTNPEKDSMMDGMAPVIPDIDLINQKSINFEDAGSLDYAYVNNSVPPECSNVTKSDEINIETIPWKTDIVSESPSEAIVKVNKPNDDSVSKLDTDVEMVPQNFVGEQQFNNVHCQLFNTNQNQYPHINPWRNSQFKGIVNQNQPMFGHLHQNKKLNIPTHWPPNILQNIQTGIYDHNRLDGNIHDANLHHQSYIQNTNFQSTTGFPKYAVALNSQKAPSNNKVKYLETTPNKNLQNFVIGLQNNYQTVLGKQIVNAFHIPDSCTFKNILTLENNAIPKITTIESTYSNDSIYKDGVIRDNKYFHPIDSFATKQILNGLSEKYDVYLTNLPHTRESLLKNIYTDTKSSSTKEDTSKEIPLKFIPVPISRNIFYPGLRYNDKLYQNINNALKRGGTRTSAIDANAAVWPEKGHKPRGESVLESIIKYVDCNSPIHHTLKPTCSKTNDNMANNVPESEGLDKLIINYIDEKTQIPAKYNNSISDSNLLQDPQRDIVQFHDFPIIPLPLHYCYDNTLKMPFKYNLIPLKHNKDPLGPLTIHDPLFNKDESSSSNLLPYTLKPSYFTGFPDFPVNWNSSLSITAKLSSYPFFSQPVARISALNPLTSLQTSTKPAYIPSPPLPIALKSSYIQSLASANINPDQSLSFSNPPKLASHQSPGLPIPPKSAYYQYPSLPVSQMPEYYPFHSLATQLFDQPNQTKFAPSPKYQLSTTDIPLTSAQIEENTNEDDVPQNNILAFNDGYDVSTQLLTNLNQLLDSLELKPAVNSLSKSFSPLASLCRYVKPNKIDAIHYLPSKLQSRDFVTSFKNTVPGHTVCSSTLKPITATGITGSYNSPLSLSMPQQAFNLMQSSSSLANNINSFSPKISSQNQIHPHTFYNAPYLQPDVKYTEAPLLSHSKISIPNLSPNVPSSNVCRSHLPTNEPFNTFNKAPNLNLISPVPLFALGDKFKTLSPLTKSENTLASPDSNMYKTYPYLPCAIHADSESNFIKKPQKMYSTIFNPQISTLQPAASSTDSPSNLFSSNLKPVDAKLSSISDPQSTVSVKSVKPSSLFYFNKPRDQNTKHPYTGISTHFPFVPSSSRLISSSSLPRNTFIPIKLNPSLKETEPHTFSTSSMIPSHPYFSQTSSSITQPPCSESYAAPLNEITRISPWKPQTQNLLSESVNNVDLYGTPSEENRYFIKNRDSYGLPSQETYTDPPKVELSSQSTCVRPSPVYQNIKLLNLPLSRQSTILENSNQGLLPPIFDKLPNEIKTSNTEVPSTLASKMFSVKPEEWILPYGSLLLQSRDNLVPETVKNPYILPSPVDPGMKPCRSDFNKLYFAPNLHKYISYVKPTFQKKLQNIATAIPFSQATLSKLPVSPNIDNNLPYDLGSSTTLHPSKSNYRDSSIEFPCTNHLNMRPLSALSYTTLLTNSRDKMSFIPKSQSASYTPELGIVSYLPGSVPNKVITPSTTLSTYSFAPSVSNVLRQPHLSPTDSSVYDYSLNIPSTTKMTPESNKDLLTPLPSPVYSPFGKAWKSITSTIQKPQKPFTTDSSPSKLFMYPSIPQAHTSMFEDQIPHQAESISLNNTPDLTLIATPEYETISSTQSSKKLDKKFNTFTSRYLPFNYSPYSRAKYLPNNYETSYSNNLDYNTHAKPLKYEKLCENKEIINSMLQTDTTLPNLETMTNTKDMSKNNNEEIVKINNNINKYIRRTLLPNILNENAVTIPLQNTCIAKCNPNDKVYYIKTENPDIQLKVWPTEIQLVKAKIVFENEKLEALNFCPVIKLGKPQYSKEVVQKLVENYVRKYYGEPIIVKSCNIQKPYEFVGDINESFIKNDKVYIVWSNLCDC